MKLSLTVSPKTAYVWSPSMHALITISVTGTLDYTPSKTEYHEIYLEINGSRKYWGKMIFYPGRNTYYISSKMPFYVGKYTVRAYDSTTGTCSNTESFEVVYQQQPPPSPPELKEHHVYLDISTDKKKVGVGEEVPINVLVILDGYVSTNCKLEVPVKIVDDKEGVVGQKTIILHEGDGSKQDVITVKFSVPGTHKVYAEAPDTVREKPI